MARPIIRRSCPASRAGRFTVAPATATRQLLIQASRDALRPTSHVPHPTSRAQSRSLNPAGVTACKYTPIVVK